MSNDLFGRLRASKRSILIYSRRPPVRSVLKRLHHEVGALKPLDFRCADGLVDLTRMRARLVENAERHEVSPVLLDRDPENGVRRVLYEAIQGRINNAPGMSQSLGKRHQIIAFMPVDRPRAEVERLFDFSIAGHDLFSPTTSGRTDGNHR